MQDKVVMNKNDFAKKPPMGWNSYDCFGHAVDEDEFKANVDYIADNLKDYGWEYCVVDFCWSYPKKGEIYAPSQKFENGKFDVELCLDEWGRPIPAPSKFPSANGSFKYLADYCHQRGLKFGIHLMRGIPRQAVEYKLPIKGASGITADMVISGEDCEWLNHNKGMDMDSAGAQEFLDSIFEQYAEWDVDYIKLDDASRPYTAGRRKEVEGYHKAIMKTGREMVLSLSPGAISSKTAPIEEAEHFIKYSNAWRIKDDVWDDSRHLRDIFPIAKKWVPFIGSGHYPDCDMLPIGRLLKCGGFGGERDSRLTENEKEMMLTLWAFVRSPLMMGGHLPESRESDLKYFKQKEIIDINQNSTENRIMIDRAKYQLWGAKVGNKEYESHFNIARCGLPKTIRINVCEGERIFDVWSGKEMKVKRGKARVFVKPMSVRLIRKEK